MADARMPENFYELAQPLFAGPHAGQVQRNQAVFAIVRPTQRLAVDVQQPRPFRIRNQERLDLHGVWCSQSTAAAPA